MFSVKTCLSQNILENSEFSSGGFIEISSSAPLTIEQESGMPEEIVEETTSLFSCPVDGCIATFQRHTNMEHHVLYGKCKFDPEKYSLLDKAKLLYHEKLHEGASKQPSIRDESSNTSSQVNTEKLPQGWALKTSKANVRFNEKQKQYLDDKFNIGQQSGHKVDPDQVSIDMRSAKDEDGKRKFIVKEFLSGQQIKSYFSRKSSKLKNVHNNEDLQAVTDRIEYSDLRKAVLADCRLTHPIIYDTYNICELYHAGQYTLKKKFTVKMFRTICEYFRIDIKHLEGRKQKEPFVQLLSDLVMACPCSSSM